MRPRALASTFLKSIAASAVYSILSLRTSGSIAPDWWWISIGIGDLLGGYLGASLQAIRLFGLRTQPFTIDAVGAD